MDRPSNNLVLEKVKGILIIKIESDVIASPMNYADTIDWYRKEIGYDVDEPLDVSYVDLKNEGLWLPIEESEEDYETLEYLRYIDGFVELIVNSPNDKFENVCFIDGELCRFVNYEYYCNKYLTTGKNMKCPEIIASSER